MVLALNTIYNEARYHVRVENYRDHFGIDLLPSQTAAYVGARWIDAGKARTVLTISDKPLDSLDSGAHRAVVSLEDIKWALVVKGDLGAGKHNHSIAVNGNKDFDIVIREGLIRFRCLGGVFQGGKIEEELILPTLQRQSDNPSLFSPSAVSAPHPPSSSSSSPDTDTESLQSIPQPPSPHLETPSSDLPSDHDQQASSSSSHLLSSSSYSISDISPDLAQLLDELRADQRRILQKEFQTLGAGYAERLMNGGRRLIGAEPVEYLPLTALLNILVICIISLISFAYHNRRKHPPTSSRRTRPPSSSSSSTSSHSRSLRHPPAYPSATASSFSTSSTSASSRRRTSSINLATRARAILDQGNDYYHRLVDESPPPPYPEEEGRALI